MIAERSPETGATPRLDWLDVLRGLALLGVVTIHVCAAPLLFPSRHSPLELRWLTLLDLAARFSVPTFLILSGALLTTSRRRRPLPYGAFLARRAGRILPPFLLWSLVYSARGPEGLTALPRHLLFGQASYHTWYVTAIAYLYLVFPLLYSLCSRFLATARGRLTLGLLACMAMFWLKWPTGSSLAEPLASWWRTGPRAALVWAPYLLVGMAVAPSLASLKVPRRWWLPTTLFGAALLALTAEARYQAVRAMADGSFAGQEATTGWWRADTALATLAMWLILLPLVQAPSRLTEPLARLGRASYGAYLAHVLVMQLLIAAAPGYLRPSGPADAVLWVLVIGFLSGWLVSGLDRLPGLSAWSGVEPAGATGRTAKEVRAMGERR